MAISNRTGEVAKVLRLHKQGLSTRAIANLTRYSKSGVHKVISIACNPNAHERLKQKSRDFYYRVGKARYNTRYWANRRRIQFRAWYRRHHAA